MAREVVVAGAREEVRRRLCRVLEEDGVAVVAECGSAAQVLTLCSRQPDVIVICHAVADMPLQTLAQLLPGSTDAVLLLASGQNAIMGKSNVICLYLPVQKPELLFTLHTLRAATADARLGGTRNKQQADIIWQAKQYLIKKEMISEKEAHRRLQKESMQSGVPIGIIARKWLTETDESE